MPIFLQISGIKGESSDAKHKDELEIESFSWGLSQSGTMASGGGAGAGKVSFQDFSFVAPVSSASPPMMLACASGQHIDFAQLSVRKAGQSQAEYLKIKLTDVLISEFKQAVPVPVSTQETRSDAPPVDSFALNFAKIEYSYSPQSADGKLGAPVTGAWDLKSNKKL